MTYFLGFLQKLSDFHAGLLLDMDNSWFVHVQTNVRALDVAQTEVFAQLMRMDYANMYLFALSGAQRSDILDKILTYYRLHLPDFGEVKSFEVLRQLFAWNLHNPQKNVTFASSFGLVVQWIEYEFPKL